MNGLLLAGYLSLFAADASTTHIALNRGAHELLLTQSPSVNDGLTAAEAGSLWWATARIQRRWLRWTVRLSIAGVHGAVAAHNMSVIRR